MRPRGVALNDRCTQRPYSRMHWSNSMSDAWMAARAVEMLQGAFPVAA